MPPTFLLPETDAEYRRLVRATALSTKDTILRLGKRGRQGAKRAAELEFENESLMAELELMPCSTVSAQAQAELIRRQIKKNRAAATQGWKEALQLEISKLRKKFSHLAVPSDLDPLNMQQAENSYPTIEAWAERQARTVESQQIIANSERVLPKDLPPVSGPPQQERWLLRYRRYFFVAEATQGLA